MPAKIIPGSDDAAINISLQLDRNPGVSDGITHYLVAHVSIRRHIENEDGLSTELFYGPMDHIWWRCQMSFDPNSINSWHRPDTRGSDTTSLSNLERSIMFIKRIESRIEAMSKTMHHVPWDTHRGFDLWIARLVRAIDARSLHIHLNCSFRPFQSWKFLVSDRDPVQATHAAVWMAMGWMYEDCNKKVPFLG